MMRGVGGVKKSIDQNSLAKGLALGLLCWGFKGVQGEIRSEEASKEDFHGAYQKFLEQKNKCIAAGGDYFKGD